MLRRKDDKLIKRADELSDKYSEFMKEKYECRGKKIIAVLGTFDTWSYMDYVCRELVKQGHYVVTSIRRYCIENGNIQFAERGDPFKKIRMRESLRYMIFHEVHVAIIIYSVPGAQYIETEWCSERIARDKKFKCYGITFVRKFEDEKSCSDLEQFNNLDCTECTAGSDHTAWKCIKIEGFCPFKRQEVAKNVIEYFFSRRMRLFALERIETTGLLLDLLL